MIKTEYLLNQVNGLLKSYEKLARSTGENFNIFSVMGMESNEVKTHSAIIGELLNPKGTHGLSDIPMKLFIEQVKVEIRENQSTLDEYSSLKTINDEALNEIFNLNTKYSKSIIEESIGKINENITEGGRIDILIYDNENKAFVIENKIYAGEQINQLGRYNKAFPNAPILYLTLFGDKPNSAGELIENEKYFIISYKKCILKWLENCVKEAVTFPMLREVINQYIYLIKKLTHQTMNNKLKEEIADLIKNNFEEASAISDNFENAKSKVITDFWKKVEKTLKKQLEGKWLVKIDKYLIKSRFNHILISRTDEEKIYFYCRYDIKKGEVNYGIILNPMLNKTEIKGHAIWEGVKNQIDYLENFKSADQSVIWKSDKEYNFSDLKILTKIFKEDKVNQQNTLHNFTDKVAEFINTNEILYNEILEHISSKQLM
jgi:hypothetical protein